jgi:hypothetical protein
MLTRVYGIHRLTLVSEEVFYSPRFQHTHQARVYPVGEWLDTRWACGYVTPGGDTLAEHRGVAHVVYELGEVHG